jgi:sulfonate transport system permease protein
MSIRGLRPIAAPVTGLALILAVWVWGGRAGWASGMIVTPIDAVSPIVGDSRDVYFRSTRATVWAAARGLAIGGTLAFTAALVAASVPRLRGFVVRLAAITNAAPWVAVAPCLLIVLGRDRGPVAVAAIAVFFFVFVSTSVGLGAASRSVHDVAGALGASRFRRVWSVQLPGSWPSVADGLKLAAPAALAGAVFGEWYGAERGLGVLLITSMQGGRADRLWAASLLSAACGLTAYGLLAVSRMAAVRRFGSEIAQQPAAAPHRHGRLRRLLTESAAIVALLAVLVALWWTWVEVKDISPIVVPRPSAVLDDLVTAPGDYLSATARTLWTAAIALTIGTVLGLAAALAAARFEFLAGMTVPFVIVLAATPLVALFPLFARVLGYNPTTVWALASVLVFYPIFVFTRSGLTAASPSALDIVDALGGRGGVRFRRVVLPAAVPHMASGFRIAAGSAVIAAVVGESLIGRQGLGVEFAYAYRLLDLPRAFGAAIVVIAVSVAVFSAAGRLERSVHTRWT